MLTPGQLFGILVAHPFPGSADLRMNSGACCFTVEGVAIGYTHNGWLVFGRVIPDEWPIPGDLMSDAARVHAEIRRVLAIVKAPAEPAPSWEQTKEDCVGPDLPGDDPLYDRAAAAQALAKVSAERDMLIVAEDTLSKIAGALAIPALEPYDDALSMTRRLVDAHTVVSQRLIGAQKEVAEQSVTIDELRTALESIAAHVGLVGSDQWAVGDVVVKVAEVTARADKMTTQAKELRVSFAEFERRGQQIESDDDLRSQLAVAVGLDDSASLALILDTVTRDRPGREISRLSGLLDVLAAPVAFGERRLSTAERAEWALRRWLAEGKECDARMAQLIEAEVSLDVLGVPAYAAVPSDDPGDASEALTVAERLRLYFGAQS